MKILLVICAIVLTNNVVNSGVVNDVYDKVKDTTQSVKSNVYSWWSSGKEFLFGKEEEGIPKDIAVQDKSVITTMYRNVYNFFDIFGDKVEGESKNIVKTMYDRVKNRVVKLKNFVLTDQVVDSVDVKTVADNSIEDYKNRSKSLKDTIARAFIGKDFSNVIKNQTEIRNKWLSLLNDIDEKRNNVGRNFVSAYEKEVELLRATYNNVQNSAKDGAKIVGDDVKKLTNAAKDTIKRDYDAANTN